MVICLSGFGADILRNHPVWLCDGTFKSTPDPFKQVKSKFLVFIVLIRIKNCSKSEYTSVQGLHYPESTEGAGIPCVYGLLPNKEMATYLKMFSIIKEHLGDCSKLSTIISDFERAVFQAVYRVFPGIEQRGCRFHFNSAIWKNIGDKGLQSLFYQNPSFQEVFYMLCGLAYVPVDKVQTFYKDYIEKQIEQTLEKDEEWADFEEEIQAFVVYFRKTWIERRGGNSALFAPNLWNQYETILQGGPQTNNMLESYNRTLNSLVGAKTNVWDFLKLVISQEANT